MHEGWRIRAAGDACVGRLPAHHPRCGECGECGELWPCRDQRLDTEARRLTIELDHSCAHCGRPLGGAAQRSFFDGLTVRRYHTAKRYRGADGTPCWDALGAARRGTPGGAGP
ncbi:MAG: hypothetical protein ACRDZN_16420 [Acidimicrobiales bacterium]